MKKVKLFEQFIAEKKALSKLDESAINEARAPKTKEELISALDDAYSKLDTYNTKYYEIGTAPGGGSWSSSSKEGKAALKYKKMAGNQQANIWKWTDKLRKLGFEYNESSVTEKREEVGEYNTVKKVVAELGRRPSEQDLATFINDNYYDVTEVERGEDDPRANDKIADLVAFYKFDIDDWEIAWEDAQNESVVTEGISKDRMIKQIKRALKDGTAIFKLPMDTQNYYRKNKGDFESVVTEARFNYKETGLSGQNLKDVKDGITGIKNALKRGNESAVISNYDLVQQRLQQYGGPKASEFLEKIKQLAGLDESIVTEAKDNLYLQLHKKYAEHIKGLKAGKIKKLTDLVSVQRWSMEDREDYFDMDSNKKKELSAEYNEERKLFKKYVAGDESVMLPKGTEALAESVDEKYRETTSIDC